MQFQCLLFVILNEEQEINNVTSSSDQSAFKGYVSLPSEVATDNEYSKVFIENGFRVISNNQSFPCLKNFRFEVLELLYWQGESKLLCVFTKKYNEEFVRSLLSKNTKVCTMYFFRADRFLSAIDEGNLKGIEHLLKYGADVTYKRLEGSTLLHLAVKRNHEMLFKLLQRFITDVNATRKNNATLLHKAAKRGQPQIVQMLIENGARVDVKMSNGLTPFHLAVIKGHPQVVEYLLEKGANVDSPITVSLDKNPCGATPLHCSIKKSKGYADVLKILLKNGANVDAYLPGVGTCLLRAVNEGYLDIIKIILEYHPDVNNEYNLKAFRNAICASAEMFKEVVGKMLLLGFKLVPEDANDSDLLLKAVHRNSVEIAGKLLEYGAEVNIMSPDSRQTPLHLAAAFGGEDMIKLLLHYGANVKAKCSSGLTPIHHAVTHNNLENVKLLLQNGTKILDDCRIAYAATFTDNPEMLAVILQNGGDPNFTTDGPEDKQTPLLVAIRKRSTEMIEVLLKYGANLVIFDGFRKVMTPLYEAIRQRNQPLFQTLLDCEFMNIKFTHESILNREFTNIDFACEHTVRMLIDLLNFHCYPISDSDLEFLRECRQKLALHILKMEAINVPVCSKLLTGHVKKMWLNESRDACKVEVASLKNEKVADTNVTFYDILTRSVNRIACFARNDRVEQALMSGEYRERFPIYAGIIHRQFQKGCHRKLLLDQGFEVCRLPANWLSALPSVILEKLLNYLSNQELIVFSNAF